MSWLSARHSARDAGWERVFSGDERGRPGSAAPVWRGTPMGASFFLPRELAAPESRTSPHASERSHSPSEVAHA
jgi:hypothetical protein